jgi:soluble lytic murein transglycosylase
VRLVTAAVALLIVSTAVEPQGRTPGQADPDASRLKPTAHPPLPADLSAYWLVPESATDDEQVLALAEGVRLIQAGDAGRGLALVTSARLADSPLADYARYYAAVAQLDLSRFAEAHDALTALLARAPRGALLELSALALADAGLALGNADRAEAELQALSRRPVGRGDLVFARLGAVEESAGHRDHALEAYREVRYRFPVSVHAAAAQQAILRLDPGAGVGSFPRERARAEMLFAARQWADARDAFALLAGHARGDDKDAIALRLAECDHYLQRHRAARDGLRPYLQGSPWEAEARYFHLASIRALGDRETFVRLARALAADHPDSDWTAEALNALASHYAALDRHDDADRVYRDLSRLFPRHRHAERAAWKVGWQAYRKGQFADTVRFFERAAATFPRADYRPAWLYWSGRARDRLGEPAMAAARYRLVVADYQNSYYGRLASRLLKPPAETPPPSTRTAAASTPRAPVPTATTIRALTSAGLYADAIGEVEHAQRVYGDSTMLQATLAWLRHTQAVGLRGDERFSGLRGGITLMRRAYPQFLAAGGENMPPGVLRIIFPLDYWPLISRHAAAHGLDPFLMAALMAQESTFTPEIRSAANAYGLMQVIPATGRSVARKIGIRPFSTGMLTQPETNVRIGMQYFKDLMNQFGRSHLALAGYNAGPHRVVRWLADAAGLAEDEFIESIPFSETQGYVKRVLGTAEDYRRLYGTGVLDPNVPLAAAVRTASARPPAGAREDATR